MHLKKFSILLVMPALLSAQNTVPAQYQDLYSSLTTNLQAFGTEISTGWNHTGSAGLASAQLSTASTDVGVALTKANYYNTIVIPELNQLQAIGIRGVVVIVNFPILYPSFFANQSDYQAYLSFYVHLASDIHARGMKMIVANGATWSQGTLNTWNVAGYYASMTFTQYVAARSSQAAIIASTVHPDYITLVSEPDTEALQTGYPDPGTLPGATTELNALLPAVRQAAPDIKIGAGTGSWMASWQSWMDSFIGAGVDYYDIHVFPINRTFLTQLPAMADYAASKGKPVASTQYWLGKERDSELTWITYNQVQARDPFSFWGPLDYTFLQEMLYFGYWKHAMFLSPFYSQYFHVYLPYNSSTSLMQPGQISSMEGTAANQYIALAQYGSLGYMYGHLLLNPPDTTPPAAPAFTKANAGPTTTALIWTVPTDNVAVAGYILYRNGVQILTTGVPNYLDTGLSPSTTYTYTVQAYDGQNNRSALSAPATVTTVKAAP